MRCFELCACANIAILACSDPLRTAERPRQNRSGTSAERLQASSQLSDLLLVVKESKTIFLEGGGGGGGNECTAV